MTPYWRVMAVVAMVLSHVTLLFGYVEAPTVFGLSALTSATLSLRRAP